MLHEKEEEVVVDMLQKKINPTPREAREVKNVNKSKLICFNYGKLGHFAYECTDPNELYLNLVSRFECYVSRQVFIAHFFFIFVL